MADTSKEARAQAEASFAKVQKATSEREKATTDYDREARAVRAKTEWLRALRLGKEAANKEGKADIEKKPDTRGKKSAS